MSSCLQVPDADGFIFGPRDKLFIATECKRVDRIRMAFKSLNDLSGGDIPYLQAGMVKGRRWSKEEGATYSNETILGPTGNEVAIWAKADTLNT